MKLFEFYELETWMVVYLAVLAFLLGAVFGSFLNCAAYRISRHKSFIKGRSICPNCNHELHILDLIPILSFLFSKGRCRYCKEKISPRYPLTEAFFGGVVLLLFLKEGVSLLFLRDFVFVCCLFCLSLVDFEIFEIPDGTVLIPILAWVLTLPFLGMGWAYVIEHAVTALVFSVAFLVISLALDKILKKESLGGGDIKLFFVVGLYLGAVGGLFAVILAAFLGLLFSKGKERIPFGPFISLGAWGMLMFGDPLVNWYLALLHI